MSHSTRCSKPRLKWLMLLQAFAMVAMPPLASAQVSDRGIHVQRLKEPPDAQPEPPDALPTDFGHQVATDGRTAIVAVDQGRAAYVYERRGQRWRYRAALVPEIGITRTSADIRGDVAIIGGEVDGVTAAFVFVRNHGVWQQTQTLSGFDTEINGAQPFVALGEDFAVVGDPHGFDFQGAVHVFSQTGTGTYTHDALLTGTNTTQGALVGYGVHVSGETILASSPGYQQGFVFTRTGGIWHEQQRLSSSIGSLDVNIDISGDTIVAATSRGTVTFERTGGVWTETQVLDTVDTGPMSGPVVIDGDVLFVGYTGTSGSIVQFTRHANGRWQPARTLRTPFVLPYVGASFAYARGVFMAGLSDVATPHPLFEGAVYSWILRR
jgi:hypothetical protein